MIKGVFFRLPKCGRPRDLRPYLYVAFVEEDGEEADGEDQRPRPDAQGHRQVHTHLLQDTHTFEQTVLLLKVGFCSSTVKVTKKIKCIHSSTIKRTKKIEWDHSSLTIEGAKKIELICSSTIERTKKNECIRSSTIDDFTLLVSYILYRMYIGSS
jgi:hypothetical protein